MMMKKTMLLLVGVLCYMATFAQSPFTAGDGTTSSPYQITTTVQLDSVRNYMTSHFKLMNDLNLTNDYPTWIPLGKTMGDANGFTIFSGSFDGKGHVISGINIEMDGNHTGLFGVATGKIINLGVNGNINILIGGSCGLLAGYLGQANAPAEIDNCFAIGNVKTSGTATQVGLLIGNSSNGSSVRNSYSKGTVIAENCDYVGGLVGRMQQNSCIIFNSYSEADVTGKNYVGGLCGRFYSNKNMNIGYLYATGSVTGNDWVGGVAGDFYNANNRGAIIAANSSVTATGSNVNRVAPTASGGGANVILDNIYGLSTTEVLKGGVPATLSSNINGSDGLTTSLAELQDPTFYASWNLSDIWSIPATPGLPILQPRVILRGNELFSGGTGTQGDPWQITTVSQLDEVRYNLNDTELRYFKLMNDIDLSDIAATNNWVPYRDASTGKAAYMDFDGNGHVIKNLHIESDGAISNYQSFAGFLNGKISNLGLINVHIKAHAVGAMGAFTGYVGALTPAADSYKTGIIENCFATGYLSAGGGTVGGIAGNIGRPANDGTPSYIKNCYFSGELYNTYAGASATVRTGGIVGLIYANVTEASNIVAPVQNSYATGYFHAIKGRVGGIVGETELTIQNSISYANLYEEAGTENSMGSIVGWCVNDTKWGKVENCYAYEGIEMKSGITTITPSNFTTPAAGMISPVDGIVKDVSYLSTATNYATDINFAMSGTGAVWSDALVFKYPQLLWVSQRSDSKEIDGLFKLYISVKENATTNQPTVFATGNLLIFKDITETYQVAVYDVKGATLKNFELNADGATIIVSQSPFVIVKLVSKSGVVTSTKVVCK